MFCHDVQNAELWSRWNNHLLQWQMVWPIVYDVWLVFCQGVADGIATDRCCSHYIEFCLAGIMPRCDRCIGYCCIRVDYFNFSSWVLIRTSSHICDRCYLSMFYLYFESVIVLLRFSSFLYTILKLSTAVVWNVMLQLSCIGEGARCSLNLFPKVLKDSPVYSS